MQKIKDIVRLKHKGLSDRLVALALKVSKGSVNAIDYVRIEKEFARPKVTLQLLWEEYRESHPDGMGRSMFYEGFRNYRKRSNPTMVIPHKGGDKLYVDYSGDSLCYTDRESGEKIKTQLFVTSFGASSYTYAEATHTQSKEDWTMSHVRAFEFFGGLPKAIVPDNLKSAVTKPRDKGVVESNVLHVQRRILASLRDKVFFGLGELNKAIYEELVAFNARGMKDYGMASRRKRFESLDQPHLDEISMERFAICALQTEIRVRKDYHIVFDSHHYSCPHELVGERVDVHQVGQTLEFYHKGEHICRHRKQPCNHEFRTTEEHMPPNHKHAGGHDSSWYIFEGGKIGPSTSETIKQVVAGKRHPEVGIRMARGVLSLARKYDKINVLILDDFTISSVDAKQTAELCGVLAWPLSRPDSGGCPLLSLGAYLLPNRAQR